MYPNRVSSYNPDKRDVLSFTSKHTCDHSSNFLGTGTGKLFLKKSFPAKNYSKKVFAELFIYLDFFPVFFRARIRPPKPIITHRSAIPIIKNTSAIITKIIMALSLATNVRRGDFVKM